MKKTTILVADDETEIADLVELHLNKEGFRVVKAANGEEALRAIQLHTIDLAILDIMMPGMDGMEVTRRIRSEHPMPIIMLSAKTSDFDKISGLVIGADDYMTKPFNPMELVARVNAQLRRTMLLAQQSKVPDNMMVEAAGLALNPEQRSAVLYGEPLELTPKEFDILYLLASHPKKVFSAENLFQQVWKEDYYEGGNTVMVHIRTLRRKLGDDKDKWIKTVWGVGYKFNV
ncbi:response regulator transcription factor [Paenibacillus herberti]|uniref:DNA-binding response regulator n=1 Tax=Paenibacillus herberti TaxID=1619309 RepID=A0A229P588_9BACL|nr:response regulator transcription factor [Paenibacillus herberti]OXM17433.1 DNA-binding response regulator [Paenibacillus herberti]